MTDDFDELDVPEEKASIEDEWNKIQEQMANGTFKPKPPQWHTVESPYQPGKVRISRERYDAIMFDDEPCPVCNGTGKIQVVQQWGETESRRTVAETCPVDYRMKAKLACIKRLLPMRYQRSSLYTLKPSSNSKMSMEHQAKIIQHLRDNPNRGFFFYGEPGTSKTTFATALVRYALERDWDRHVVAGYGNFNPVSWIHYLNWDTYIQSLLDWQNHPDTAEEPDLTPSNIRKWKQKGYTPCVVIEEIDKSRLTEFKANKLFDLVCAMDEAKSQLIMTTNYATKEDFQAWLCQADTRLAGEATWRRILDNCKIVNCKEK